LGSKSEEQNIELTVIIPTFNEAANIGKLIDRLIKVLEEKGPRNFEILVVDDNSPDGTCLIVREKAVRDKRIRCLLRRKNRGLATAILRGIAWARGKYVVVLDADFQHPPEKVPELYWKAVETGADIVVGSRYTKGGGIEGWSRLRLLMSKGANLVARLFVPNMKRVSDPMSGFFLVRRDVVDLSRLTPRGYKVLMEIIAKTDNARIVEVPYTFRQRAWGKSKLGAKTIADFIVHVISLSPLIKFGIVGLLGALLNILVMLGGLLVGAPIDLASLAGIEAGLLFNFALHERWTFETGMRGSWKSRLLGYHLTSAGGMITTYAVMRTLVTLQAAAPVLAQMIGIIAGFGVNYTLSRSKVWGSKADAQTLERRGISPASRRNKELH
jgi:dolichol-phosphate mannosyltransferase